jgi:hypothetical protein
LKPTGQQLCQAKGCAKPGKPRFTGQWSYFICVEHDELLSDADKKHIARTEGTRNKQLTPIRRRPS